MSVQYLYKYRSIKNQNIDKLFTHNQLYFASPRDFNDPFGCKIPASLQGSKKEIKALYKWDFKTNHLNLTRKEVNLRLKDLMKKKVYKDGDYLEDAAKKTLKEVTKDVGIFCLSEKKDDILMWAHYSYGHKGFCIEFKATEPFFESAMKVKYQKE